MNDPWTPQVPSNVTLLPAPADPLHQIISSDKYLESLEKKLGRLKGRNVREPTPQDIVKSLSRFRDDQMNHFLKGERPTSSEPISGGGDVTSSYIQRRLYPEKQPVSGEELVVLIQDDALAKRIEEQQEIEELSATVSMTTGRNTLKSENSPKDEGDIASKETVAIETISVSETANNEKEQENQGQNAT